MLLIYYFFYLFCIIKVLTQKHSTCYKDYSHNCAKGWSKLSYSRECVSPLSYKGPCPRFLQIEIETYKKKMIEQQCNIQWPCLVRCKQNYSSQCPENWVPEDDKKCRPLATYNGPCLLSYDFSNMTDEQKEIWSNKCETTWPCKEKCQKNYSKVCPQGWTRDSDGLCSSPKTYNGPCLPRASLFSLDSDMKKAFEKLCKLDYPCLHECEIDMNDPCPQNWILKSDQSGVPLTCLPPDNYQGDCDENMKFIGLNLELKENMAYECGIKWPCIEETPNLIDYAEFCPENWERNREYCIAPQNYTGPCSKKKIFESFSKNMKKAYAEECNLKWPLLKNMSKHISKNSIQRKGKQNFGAVEPITGEVVSKIKNK